MKVDIRVDYAKELKRITEEASKITVKDLEEKTKFATAALKSVTPVKTGFARDSWKSEMIEGVGIITNDAPYIEALNRGHSKQAPPFFIEEVMGIVGQIEVPTYEVN